MEHFMRAAVHEAGHALSAWFSPFVRSLDRISLIEPSGAITGYSVSRAEVVSPSRTFRWTRAAIALGGIAGELAALGVAKTKGAEPDLLAARADAEALAADAGMDHCPWQETGTSSLDIGLMFATPPSPDARSILNVCHLRNKRIIAENRMLFEAVVAELLVRRSLEPVDIERIFGKRLVIF
jgi:ATP-dependent Zn protease